MTFWNLLGLLGILLTATQLMPQIIKTIRTKHVEDLSIGLVLIICFGSITWILYGWHRIDYAVVIANIINFVCAVILLILKLKSLLRKQKK